MEAKEKREIGGETSSNSTEHFSDDWRNKTSAKYKAIHFVNMTSFLHSRCNYSLHVSKSQAQKQKNRSQRKKP
jgi:hypothetical protein